MPEVPELRFRQVHLDFHTSPAIPEIGERFDKKLWQERLQTGHVNSITCFSCCHHGWSYHPTQVGAMHPGLNINLLRAQMDACHEIDVKVPIYLTAGVNNYVGDREPGWREITPEGKWSGWEKSPFHPGFHKLCFNSPYMDYLCRLIEEAAQLFPDADGMFFDIIMQGECCCPACMRDMKKEGYNPEDAADRQRFALRTLKNYMRRATEAARSVRPDMPVFHNSNDAMQPGHRDMHDYFSHLELESLPTGGWGYDHFPLVSAYSRTLDKDFLGMTGKFHTTWGEFGGFKHPNALRYECCAMLAQGAKCSIGDQLHPSGMLDESTYRLIGQAYQDVEAKEPWCRKATSAATVGMLANCVYGDNSQEANLSEIGLSRLLLEAHIPFDRLDREADFAPYQALILADNLRPDATLRQKLADFTARGGKLILSGNSLLCQETEDLAFDMPVEDAGLTEMFPNFIQLAPDFNTTSVTTPFVMYRPSRNITLTGGQSLGSVFEPYFNRSYEHFCSHQHTPNKLAPSPYQAGVLTDHILYFAHPVFLLYALYGTVNLKEFVVNAMRQLMGDTQQLLTSLPSQGRVTLMEQKSEHRYIAHALFATPSLRGYQAEALGNGLAPSPLEVIEELHPLYQVKFSFNLPLPIQSVTLEPQGEQLPFELIDGRVEVTLPQLTCHQMMALHY